MKTDDPPDAELWARAVAGSGSDFGLLFDRHAKAVYNHCFRLCASWSQAEDLTQSTFLVAWRKRDSVVLEHDSARPWLLAVATNVVRNERRSVRRRLGLTARVAAERPTADHADDVVARIDDERSMARLLAAMRRLPHNQQEALALCVWSEVSYAEAAAVLGIAEASVRARVSKARARLARLLDKPIPLSPMPLEQS
ncbi:RNA polymerase sigma factor [Actinophytocola xanthii]|uniref:RNA polymerase sigma factor n=1 Tax=Actinophytocola xanthii TaxID=1912961 RepID=A0A1Q8BXR1_9PSEU|nr:RNA polymerase sigma factor [Actinophytocola xanthii]OLF06889.1 RNA polymerase subunit sigma-70 [Actinophytocola xanthii]